MLRQFRQRPGSGSISVYFSKVCGIALVSPPVCGPLDLQSFSFRAPSLIPLRSGDLNTAYVQKPVNQVLNDNPVLSCVLGLD